MLQLTPAVLVDRASVAGGPVTMTGRPIRKDVPRYPANTLAPEQPCPNQGSEVSPNGFAGNPESRDQVRAPDAPVSSRELKCLTLPQRQVESVHVTRSVELLACRR